MNFTEKIILALIIIALFFTGQMAYSNYQEEISGFCSFGTGCVHVQNSEYGEILGVKVSYLGITSFFLLFISFILSGKIKFFKKFFLILTILGTLFAIYFIYIQLFILKSICSSCMIVDTTMLLIFIITLYNYKYLKIKLV